MISTREQDKNKHKSKKPYSKNISKHQWEASSTIPEGLTFAEIGAMGKSLDTKLSKKTEASIIKLREENFVKFV